jgi:hypothetical protein
MNRFSNKAFYTLIRNIGILLVSLVLSFESYGEEEIITIEGTRIKGNQESPTILYVIPWQAPEIEALDPAGTIKPIDNSLEKIERSEFVRLLGYHEHFKRIHYSEDSIQEEK